MSVSPEATTHRSVHLPNGLTVYGLSANDTVMVYRDIFEDACYRRHGVTITDGDCILDVGANTGAVYPLPESDRHPCPRLHV
jgi:hypothetical protein